MEESGICRGLLLQDFHSSFANPTPYLAKQETDKHNQKPTAHLSPEYCHGKACFRDGEPRFFVQLFGFDGPEWAIEKTLQAIKKEPGCDEEKIH